MSTPVSCDLLIRDATLVDSVAGGSATRVRANHDIAVTGNAISAVAPTGTLEVSAKHSVDGHSYATLPGLVNAHAHSAMSLLRGLAEDVDVTTWFNDIIWRVESNLTPEDAYWGMKLAIVEMIESGVTTVADHYMFMADIARACQESGMRAHLAPTMFDQDPDRELGQAADFVAQWHRGAGGRITAWLGPHSPYLCSPQFLQRCVGLAGELGVGIHLHLAETRSQVTASLNAHGLTPPKHLQKVGLFDVPVLCAHATHATSDDIRLLAQHRAGVAHCPKTFLKLASGIANISEMLDHEVAVGFGSDGPASNNTLDILEQMRLAAMLQKHQHGNAALLNTAQALALASGGGARALRQDQLVGALEVGHLADLVLIDLSGAHLQPLHDLPAALVYSARAADVDTVIVDGQLLMEKRRLVSLDKEEVIAEASQRGFRLAGSPKGRRIQTFPGGPDA